MSHGKISQLFFMLTGISQKYVHKTNSKMHLCLNQFLFEIKQKMNITLTLSDRISKTCFLSHDDIISETNHLDAILMHFGLRKHISSMVLSISSKNIG